MNGCHNYMVLMLFPHFCSHFSFTLLRLNIHALHILFRLTPNGFLICPLYPDLLPITHFTRSLKPAGTQWFWSSCRTSMTISSPVRFSSGEECCVPAVSCTGQSTKSGFRPFTKNS